MSIFAILGWLSLVLMLVAAGPFWLKTLNNWTIKSKSKGFNNFLKAARKYHRPAGYALAVIAIIHGYLALNNRIRLHTGLLVYIGFLAVVAIGIWQGKTKTHKKQLFKVHQLAAFISLLLFLLHLVEPWALGKWFNIY